MHEGTMTKGLVIYIKYFVKYYLRKMLLRIMFTEKNGNVTNDNSMEMVYLTQFGKEDEEK